MLYNDCIKDIIEQDKDKFLLITSNSKIEIIDASKQFKNKFVFYSPSITTVIDLLLKINKMYLFILMVNHKLFYYSESKPNKPKYKSVDEVEHLCSEFIKTSDKLNEKCK